MSEQYEEVTDYRKIGLIVATICAVGIAVYLIINGSLGVDIQKNLENQTPRESPESVEKAKHDVEILTKYQDIINRYVDYGLPKEKVIEVLLADCSAVQNGTSYLGQIYDSLLEVKKVICQ